MEIMLEIDTLQNAAEARISLVVLDFVKVRGKKYKKCRQPTFLLV